MANLSKVHRVVFRHDWINLAEWADAIGQLADLTDDEIDGVTAADPAGTVLNAA